MYLSHYFNSCGGERWFDDTREFAAHLSHTRESRHRSIEKKVDETASREGISSGSAISFLEASMSRFEAWITHPTVPVGQISAYRCGLTRRENERNHKELRRTINDLGYSALLLKCTCTNKSGEPSAEWSWCVIGRTGQAPNPVAVSEDELEQQMRELAGRYDQESFVVTKPSRKQVVLVSAEGGRRSVGIETTRLGVDASIGSMPEIALEMSTLPESRSLTTRRSLLSRWIIGYESCRARYFPSPCPTGLEYGVPPDSGERVCERTAGKIWLIRWTTSIPGVLRI